jgi:hypothetical protein
MSDQINSINRSDTFNIIQTNTDFYYSPKSDTGNPRRLYLNQWRDTIEFHLPNSEKSEYWAYNLLGARDVMHLYKGSQEIYKFEDRTKTTSRLEMVCVGFHVLNDRWVVVLEYCEGDKTFICRTHDILKQKNSQSHLLAELRATSYTDIKNYSYAGEYILVMTSTHIAKIKVAPDNGTGLTFLDYKVQTNDIGLNQQIPKVNMWDVSFKHVSGLGPDGAQIRQINVYVRRSDFDDRSFHSIRSQHSFIGTINPETLENTGVVPNPTELLQGGVEYLAPDIAIHRPDLHGLTQYFTLIAPASLSETVVVVPGCLDPEEPVQSQQPTLQQKLIRQKLIQVNIHDYEHRKEQRRLYARHWNDDGRFFTLICSKWTDTQWLIYQVDRLTRTIVFMRVKAPAGGLATEIEHGGRIVISKFNLFRETVRVIEPTKQTISTVLTGIPSTASGFIAKFAKQKIINY